MKLDYWVVDAFTDTLFTGNPAAVVLPEKPLPAGLMQRIAAENNLSETAFAVPQAGGWELRWFTPTVEVDLCGHATLATSFVLAGQNHAGPFRYRTRSGELTASVSGDGIELDFPARAYTRIPTPDGLAAALGVAPVQVLQSANVVAVLESADQVEQLRPDLAAVGRLFDGVLAVTAAGGRNVDVTSRFFAPGYGIEEDPVTGALHTQVVPYWADELGRNRLTCRQASARGGTMRCTRRDDRVLLTGRAVLYARGVMFLPDGEASPG